MTCTRCGWDYPRQYLAAMAFKLAGEQGATEPLCGICALEVSNEILGHQRTEFEGKGAEQLRQMALEWRRSRLHSYSDNLNP